MLHVGAEKWIRDIENREAYAKAIRASLHDSDPAVIRAAAYTLGQMNHHPAIPHILSLLDDPRLWVRDAAVLSLIKFGEKIIPILSSALETSSISFKRLAMDIFAGIGDENSREILEKYMNHPDKNLQQAAHQL